MRHQTFFSLAELNRSIAALLVDLNQRAFKKLPGNRASAFAELDRPALRLLPAVRMADAILDRIVHGSHKIALNGESMKKLAKAA